MPRYATRTCEVCGVQRPQPEMIRVRTRVSVGRSRAGFSPMTLFGCIFGSKTAWRAVGRAVLNTAQRQRTRVVDQWYCEEHQP